MPTSEKALEVAVVSKNAETLDQLREYLCAAGVTAQCTTDIRACVDAASPAAVAYVFFPDDFRIDSVLTALADVTDRRPRALPVLVTSRGNEFGKLHLPDRALVVPRPVWGWAILDAIRAHGGRS